MGKDRNGSFGWLLSQFMSNGSLVSMLAAIAVPLALHYGIDPIPVAIACAIGASSKIHVLFLLFSMFI